jgi:hypothetical protein
VNITDSTISNNVGNDEGGGIFFGGNSTISTSTISGNSSPAGGGIFYLGSGSPPGPTLSITNSTISGNIATSSISGGGGMFLLDQATVAIFSSTIASNSTPTTGGNIRSSGASLTLKNTIVANAVSGGNCSGTVIDGGTNLQFPGTTCGATIPSADPLLQALANYGGPTQTQALSAGSPAIDAASLCPPPAFDQRGVARPQGSACDIGAVEGAVAGLPTLSINNVSQNEGNSGTTAFVFTVTLSAASASTVTVNYATADGTATAPGDYASTSGTLTFAPGATTQTITVNVVGDTTPESNETFSVILSAPTNATIAAGTGTGTIVNDDAGPPPPVATTIPTLSEWALLALAAMLFMSAAMSLRRRRR